MIYENVMQAVFLSRPNRFPGVFIASTTKLAVWWGCLSYGAPDMSGAPATSPKLLRFDHWSSDFWARLDVRWRTGHVL